MLSHSHSDTFTGNLTMAMMLNADEEIKLRERSMHLTLQPTLSLAHCQNDNLLHFSRAALSFIKISAVCLRVSVRVGNGASHHECSL